MTEQSPLLTPSMLITIAVYSGDSITHKSITTKVTFKIEQRRAALWSSIFTFNEVDFNQSREFKAF